MLLLGLVTILIINISAAAALTCHLSQYRSGGGCCSNCPPGSRVKADCTGSGPTYCVPCSEGTFMDLPSGNKSCYRCSSCDSGAGLKERRPCGPSSDTFCEPLEGFFCIDSTSGSCSAAQRHSSCGAGEFISKSGTSSSDSECSPCSGGTFSNGSSTSCQPHTQCETRNLQLVKAGTPSADAECGGESVALPAGLGVGFTVLQLVGLAAAAFYYRDKIKSWFHKLTDKRSNAGTHSPIEEHHQML